MASFQIRFDPIEIRDWAKRYSYPGEFELLEEIVPRIRVAGHLNKIDLVSLGRWKSPRIVPALKRNTDDEIEEVTHVALSTKSERLRIGALIQLEGVGWPVASTVLHLCHDDAYPILDFRALWSLGVDKPPAQYSFGFWWDYTCYCRELARATEVPMRTLDRALWQYSKKNQTENMAAKMNSKERDGNGSLAC